MVLQLLAWITSKRKVGASFCPVIIDEFSAFVFDGFEQFLNKARSKNIAIHLSHQSLGDLQNVSDSFAKTINVNTNVKVLLGLNDPDTADYMARHLGTRTKQKTT
jgi:type IV secretory pathway TraG/TraD family ATPase VirD4